MRKIEQQMVQAVENSRVWAAGNTSVSRDADNPNMMVVSLHGNHIASIEIADGRILGRWINLKTLADYPTATTLSRLRALGFRVCRAKGQVIIGVLRPGEGNLVAEYVLEEALKINKGKPLFSTWRNKPMFNMETA